MLKRAVAISVFALCVFAAPASAGLILFQSPSGNIGCTIAGKYGVRCDIAEHSWTAPPKPQRCELDWGGGVAVGKKGKAGFVCAGDTTLHQGNPLPYGHTVKNGRYKCTSKEAGMRCVNTRNKHGFLLARDSVRVF